jgi:hypothetical protein
VRIGDIVLYRMGLDVVLPAIVTHVWPNNVLNLTVFSGSSAIPYEQISPEGNRVTVYPDEAWLGFRRTSVSHGSNIGHWQPREQESIDLSYHGCREG